MKSKKMRREPNAFVTCIQCLYGTLIICCFFFNLIRFSIRYEEKILLAVNTRVYIVRTCIICNTYVFFYCTVFNSFPY